MQKSKKKIEPIPDEFKTLMEASDFWDTHDIADYWDETVEQHRNSIGSIIRN